MSLAARRPVIYLENATFEYQPGVGIYDVNLGVEHGTIFGLIGPSGCGKTTTIRMILGLLSAQEGIVEVLGRQDQHISRSRREQIGYLPQQFVLYPDLSVNENMRFVASLYGLSLWKRGKRIGSILDLVELSDARRRLAGALSGGMRKRLELAGALLHEPSLVFADEPTSGIDPVLRAKIWDYIREYRSKGNSLFVTTQYVGEAMFCDVVGVMKAGRLVHVDTPTNLYRLALGGEIVSLSVNADQMERVEKTLEKEQRVLRLQRLEDNPGSVHITVDDSGTAIPWLLDLFSQQANIDIYKIDRYQPSFDAVFATLLEKTEAA